jgi:hypothetical protein
LACLAGREGGREVKKTRGKNLTPIKIMKLQERKKKKKKNVNGNLMEENAKQMKSMEKVMEMEKRSRAE